MLKVAQHLKHGHNMERAKMFIALFEALVYKSSRLAKPHILAGEVLQHFLRANFLVAGVWPRLAFG
jgi:hypothetical protein